MSSPPSDRAAFEPALPEAAEEAWAVLSARLLDLDGDVERAASLAASLPPILVSVPEDARLRLRCAALVALDLARQGWWFSDLGGLCVAPPDRAAHAVDEKARVRGQLHVERDRQLQEPSVYAFIRRMQTRRLFEGRWVSVFDRARL